MDYFGVGGSGVEGAAYKAETVVTDCSIRMFNIFPPESDSPNLYSLDIHMHKIYYTITGSF